MSERADQLIDFIEWVQGSGGEIRMVYEDEGNTPIRLVTRAEAVKLVEIYWQWRDRFVWGAYLSTGVIEGQVQECLARVFRTKASAEAWISKQLDYYPGHPMYVLREIVLDLNALDGPEGLRIPT